MQNSKVIDLDKTYRGNTMSGKKIKNALSKKQEIRSIQHALASYCFSIITIVYPDHPLLSDSTKVEVSAFEDIDSLFITLNESIKTKNDDDTKSKGSNESYQSFNSDLNSQDQSNVTRDPDYLSDDDYFISTQNPDFKANIKIEPEDSELTFTPRIIRKNSQSTPSGNEKEQAKRPSVKLTRSPFDDISGETEV